MYIYIYILDFIYLLYQKPPVCNDVYCEIPIRWSPIHHPRLGGTQSNIGLVFMSFYLYLR